MKRTLVLVLGLFSSYTACGDESTGAAVSASGMVVNLRARGDRITFALYKNLPEFVIEIPQPEQADPLFAALQNASTTLRGVVVRYSPDSADLSAGEALPTFRVVGLTYEGREVPVPAAGRSATRSLSGPEQAWARGVGLYVAGKHGDAISEFDRALADSSLTSGQRLQGYKLRGLAIVDGVQSESRSATDAGDRKLIRAVDDLRKWQALAPDDAEPLYQIGFALRGLGAYSEALQIYEEVSHSWPTEYFWSAIRIGDTYRESGDRHRALAALDDLLKEHGAQRGMAFHYHRGWALIDVGRYSEAIEELTRGLDDQPNFPWAFAWRACAENQASRFDAAVRDQQTAVTLVNELADDSLPSQFNQKRAVEIETNLEAAAAEHRVAPFSTVCNGYWEGDGSRQRSSQLPQRLAWVPIQRDPIRAFLASHRMTIVGGMMVVLLSFGFAKWRAYLVRSR